MIIVDASVWIDFFNKNTPPSSARQKLRNLIEAEADIAVGDLTYLEVLRGFRHDSHHAAAKNALDAFDRVTMLDHQIALTAASLYRNLRRQGITIRNTPDLITATFCLQNNAQLLHKDRDFAPLATIFGLRVI